jgi:hypothetical protein
MAVAIGLDNAGKRINGRGGKREWKYGTVPKDGQGLDHAWRVAIGQAGVVLDHKPELADAVLAGEPARRRRDAQPA